MEKFWELLVQSYRSFVSWSGWADVWTWTVAIGVVALCFSAVFVATGLYYRRQELKEARRLLRKA